MSWSKPIGKRLRYRNTPIVCTGGKQYCHYIPGTIPGILDEKCFNAIEVPNGGIERQWDCIRGKCTDSNYSKKYPEEYFFSSYQDYKQAFDYESLTDPLYAPQIGVNFDDYLLYAYPGFSNIKRKNHWKHEGECSSILNTLHDQTDSVYKEAREKSLENKYIRIDDCVDEHTDEHDPGECD